MTNGKYLVTAFGPAKVRRSWECETEWQAARMVAEIMREGFHVEVNEWKRAVYLPHRVMKIEMEYRQ